jgi:hypothetical protein
VREIFFLLFRSCISSIWRWQNKLRRVRRCMLYHAPTVHISVTAIRFQECTFAEGAGVGIPTNQVIFTQVSEGSSHWWKLLIYISSGTKYCWHMLLYNDNDLLQLIFLIYKYGHLLGCVTYERVLDMMNLVPTSSYSAIADVHTLQFTVTHALGFSVFTSPVLATDL